MSTCSTISALLSREEEPGQGLYNGAVESIVKDPQEIRRLIEGDTKHESLIQLTAHSHRLARVFRGLRSFAQKEPKSSTTVIIAAETVTLLVETLPSLHQLLTPAQVLEILVPALDICFTSYTHPTLRELASVLAECGTLLEHLAADRFGSEIIRQWAYLPGISALDARSLEIWTNRLVNMVRSCMGNHDVEEPIQQWGMLQALKTSLRNLEQNVLRPSEHQSKLAKPCGPPPLGRMTQLNREDKKAHPAGRQNIHRSFPFPDNDDKILLQVFDLQVPGSWSTLADVIKSLEDGKTSAILLSVASSFPCNLCVSRLSSSSQITNAETQDECIGALSNLQIEIADKGIGIWQIRMSAQALKSVQNMGSHGLSGAVTEKFRDLASGCWNPQLQPLAGSRTQRKKLKIPVARTKVGQRHSILWQIDVGMDGDTEVPLQEIKVWEVCVSPDVSKWLDRIIFLQGGYSDEAVRRCCRHPLTLDGVQIPARFDNDCSPSAALTQPSTAFDVRTVDPDTIEMTNKFYALTEPVMRSIIANDLFAEFPFDLSKEEARVIRHFRTASLILGRSGTGKTTCLVIKLVRKYLASKAVVDERPARQVLLTRSGFLADKLGAYTRRLIETLSFESRDLEWSQLANQVLSMTVEENSEKQDVSTLRDHSFPLICTWDHFLRLLENTAAAFDRQNFLQLDGHHDLRSAGFAATKRRYHGQLIGSYDFQVDYWPRFSHTLTKDISVNLVFAEIMGVIKGSASSRDSLAPLCREEYLTRSCRLAPTFVLEAERSRVYDIFEMYETLKIDRGDVDYVNRVVRILKVVRRDPSLRRILRSAFDEVYIDEIQDQRCIDIELLLSFVRDGRGLHFAGDTAQAISQDSTFRFSDIKDIFFQHFSAASTSANQSELARPEMFTLSKNYRSHQGILALASLVMGLIWQGFPDTVDKLEPEIGNLNGPKPVLFIGVDYNILRSSNVGLVNLSDRVADFGAEQVILVRDEAMKARLQSQIGDIALILTILDSKGMEFDDVILWDFFTSSPDLSGVRSLSALMKDTPSGFDGQRHPGMCSELKHFYVAITRARIQLFLMESSEKVMVSVVELLNSGSSGSLVDAIRPHEEGFLGKLKMLRPGTSVDPARWSLRGDELMRRQSYEDAQMCFRKAKNHRGESIASGKLYEAKGRKCQAKNDIQGFTENLEFAIDLFLQIDMIDDAATNLERLSRFRDAAELWLQRNEFAKAAPLFAEAGLYVQAVDCYHTVGNHGGAAAILRQGQKYDEMVSYICNNREDIPIDSLRSFILLCKMLLKKDKITPPYRKAAFKVLGSAVEQEAAFVEYEMYGFLADLYLDQQRYKDLFDLLAMTGQLEEALRLAATENLSEPSSGVAQSQIVQVLDYVCAGRSASAFQQMLAVNIRSIGGFESTGLEDRIKQWELSCAVHPWEASSMRQRFTDLKDTVGKRFLSLQTILAITAMSKESGLDDVPFEAISEAIRIIKDLVLKSDGQAQSTILLFTGLWNFSDTQDRYNLLPWSPFNGSLTDIRILDGPRVAKQWILDKLASATLVLEARARTLWMEKWPKRCVHFMTVGFCRRKQNREECHWLHQPVSADHYSGLLDDLLQVNRIFCELGALFYCRVMNESFQDKYLGIKRHWLERLLRELTHLSAVEQNTSAMAKTQGELCGDKKWFAISSYLDEMLQRRLVKEWSERSDYTSLLEQMQRAQPFGPYLQNRVFRALSYRLYKDGRGLLQRHLGLLNSIERGLSSQGVLTFQDNLNKFLQNHDNIDVQALSTLHALTAVFEYLAAYLILKTCVAACVLTQAWIDLYVPRFNDAVHSAEPLQSSDLKCKFQKCLMELTKTFCAILRRLNEVPQSDITLLCSGKPHHPWLLRQRNAELVAIVVANLAPARPTGLAELWTTAKEAFGYDFVRAYHFRSLTPTEIIPKLATSFLKYNSKDALVVVIKDRSEEYPFSSLEHQSGVKTAAFDQLCPLATTSATTQASADVPLPTSSYNPEEEFTPTETEATTKIQRLWRSYSRSIKNRRSYMELPDACAIAHFVSLGAACPATLTFIEGVALRDILISNGVAMSLRLAAARDRLSNLQKDAMTCVTNVEISTALFESVDLILGQNREVESLLGKAEEKMSDESLTGLVKLGVHSLLKKAMKEVGDYVAGAEMQMLETRKIVDTVSRNCAREA